MENTVVTAFEDYGKYVVCLTHNPGKRFAYTSKLKNFHNKVRAQKYAIKLAKDNKVEISDFSKKFMAS